MNDTLLRLDNICPHEVNQDLPIEYDHAYYDMSEKWIIKMFDAHLKAYYLENGWSGNTSVAGNASMSFVNRTIVTFDDFHQVLESFVNITGEPKNELFDSFQAIVDSLDINQDVVVYRTGLLKDMIIFVAYLLLIVISLFGNLLVLFIILSQRQLRQQTTNKLIANLTVSDLFLTTFNIPLTIGKPRESSCFALLPKKHSIFHNIARSIFSLSQHITIFDFYLSFFSYLKFK